MISFSFFFFNFLILKKTKTIITLKNITFKLYERSTTEGNNQQQISAGM